MIDMWQSPRGENLETKKLLNQIKMIASEERSAGIEGSDWVSCLLHNRREKERDVDGARKDEEKWLKLR